MYRHIAVALALFMSVAASPTLQADDSPEETRIEDAKRELDRLTRLTRHLEEMLRRLDKESEAASKPRRSTVRLPEVRQPKQAPATEAAGTKEARQRFVLGKKGWIAVDGAKSKPTVVIQKDAPKVASKRRVIIRTDKDGKVEERIFDLGEGDLPADLPDHIKKELGGMRARSPRAARVQPPRTKQKGRFIAVPSAQGPKGVAGMLERILKRLDRIDQRLTRIEQHIEAPVRGRHVVPPSVRRRGVVRFLDRSGRPKATSGPDISDETIERLLQHPELERLKKEAFEQALRELKQENVEVLRRRVVRPGNKSDRRVIRLVPGAEKEDVEIEIR